MKHDKPLFIPLKTEYYEKFERGEKTKEFRRGSDKRWSAKHCYEGRAAVLSKGYGKQSRLDAVVAKHELLPLYMLAQSNISDFIACYGPDEKTVNVISFKSIKARLTDN